MTGTTLSSRLARALASGVPAILVTVGADGWGHAAMTWAVALAPARGAPAAARPRAPIWGVRFIADRGSATEANLARTGKAALQVIGRDDLVALIKGPARECRGRVAASPFAMAMWELAVAEIKDQAWPPVAVAPLAYEWRGPDAGALRAIEQAVLAELRDWPGPDR